MAVRVFESPNQGKLWVGPWLSVDGIQTQALMPYFAPHSDRYEGVSVEQERRRLSALLKAGRKLNLVAVENSMLGSLEVGALLTRHFRRGFRQDGLAIEACGVAGESDRPKAYSPRRQALGALVYGVIQGLDPEARVEERPQAQDGSVLREFGADGVVTVGGLQAVLTGEFEWLRNGRTLPGVAELINPQNLPEEQVK